MMRINIAGIKLATKEIPVDTWHKFVLDESTIPNVEIDSREKMVSRDPCEKRIEHDEIIVSKHKLGRWVFESPANMPPAQVGTTANYENIEYFLPNYEDHDAQRIKLNHLLRTAFECRFCHEGIVSLHAACVEKDGYAVAFTGHSGLGKSTRAKAWVDALGAEWISGDRPAVRLEKEGSTACGVPWDGKEQIFRNVERPLKAILEVRRSSANYVRKLTADQARRLLMQQTFVPMWDTDTAVLAMANVRKLIRQTPVYRVFCGPDGDDAREIYDILFHHPEKIREEAEDMKIKDGFVLRNVVDEHIVMPTGDNIAKFEGAVVLNDVSAFVFEQLKNNVSLEDLLLAVLNEFDVEESTAKADLENLLVKFEEMGLIEK